MTPGVILALGRERDEAVRRAHAQGMKAGLRVALSVLATGSEASRRILALLGEDSPTSECALRDKRVRREWAYQAGEYREERAPADPDREHRYP